MGKKYAIINLCLNCPNSEVSKILNVKIKPSLIYLKLEKGKCPFFCSICDKKTKSDMEKCAKWLSLGLKQ